MTRPVLPIVPMAPAVLLVLLTFAVLAGVGMGALGAVVRYRATIQVDAAHVRADLQTVLANQADITAQLAPSSHSWRASVTAAHVEHMLALRSIRREQRLVRRLAEGLRAECAP